MWRFEDEEPVDDVTLVGHGNQITSLALHPASNRMATGSRDMTIRLWDLASGQPSETSVVLRGHQGKVNSVTFSPDGNQLLSAADDRTARLWDLCLNVLLAHARQTAGRELTEAEQTKYVRP